MKAMIVSLVALFTIVSCGIKGDPVPPTKPFDWGQDSDAVKKKKAEGEN